MNNQKVKALLSESARLIDERKELTSQIQDALKKDINYLNMVEEKKSLETAIKEREEFVASSIIEERKKVNESLKLVKEDLSEDLEIKKRAVSKLVSFYKTKLDTNQDELDVIVNAWVSIFEEE